MARTYYNTSNATFQKAMEVQTSKPFDTRIVVENLADLYDSTASGFKYAYKGLVVYVISEGCQYAYIGTSGKAADIKNSSKWIKLGGSDISTSDYAAVVLDSEDGLTSITTPTPYKGMLAVVKDDADSSEDEGALYILIADDATDINNWMKIGGGSTVSSNVDITTDGTAPTSGNGFSIDPDDSDAYVEDEYVNYADCKLLADTYYTGNGFGSFNGGYGNLEGVTTCVELKKNNSIIKFWANNDANTTWIKIDLDNEEDFGISYSDIVDEDGNPCTEVLNGHSIKFLKDLDLSGATEVRDEDESVTYLFGTTGSTIADLDIYISKVLPTVYAYVNGESVKVMTEGDKEAIMSAIDEIETGTTPEAITDDEIDDLFDDGSESEE